MKRMWVLIVLVAISFLLVACGGDPKNGDNIVAKNDVQLYEEPNGTSSKTCLAQQGTVGEKAGEHETFLGSYLLGKIWFEFQKPITGCSGWAESSNFKEYKP